VLIVVIIFVAVGIAFAIFISFLVINKIIKRHLHIIKKKTSAAVQVVKDKDNLQ